MYIKIKFGEIVPWIGISLPMAQRIRFINILTPNVNYSGRTAPLTSKVAFYVFIQQI